MKRLIGASIASLLAACLLLAGSITLVVAASDDECPLQVEPAQAAAGSQFMLGGAGYTPIELILQRDDGPAVSFDLQLGDADPFEVPVDSKPGDEGLWRATVVTADGCRGSVEFRVTLPSTDAIDELLAMPGPAGLPPIGLLAVVVLGFGAGTLIGRYARRRA